MEIRVGPSFTFSILIVIAAAIAFHEPEAAAPTARKAETVASPAPEPRSSVEKPAEHVEETPTPPESIPPKPVAPPEPIASAPTGPRTVENRHREAFTKVEAGESLAEVARRVYGKDDEATIHDLWLANRDQLASLKAEVREGMILRTP